MTGSSTADSVRLRQEAFYVDAETNRFEWLTRHPIIRRAEQRLLAALGGLEGNPSILEIGCGEGANFVTLQGSGKPFRYTGFDCFPAKIGFCRRRHRHGRFVVADARHGFPFNDRSYDRVLVRDVLHHLEESERSHVIREAMRVLSPGGKLWIIEGNAANLLGYGFAMLFPHERCMLETRAPRLQRFVRHTLPGYQIDEAMEEPSNFFRMACHYQFGFPSIGHTSVVRWLTHTWDRLSRVVRPQRRWAYSIVEVRKPTAHSA